MSSSSKHSKPCKQNPCDQSYRVYDRCGAGALNVVPPKCLLRDPQYKAIYNALYNGILNNYLEVLLNNLIQADAANGPVLYNAFLATLLTVFGITLGTDSPRLLVAESDGTVVIDTSRAADSPNANTYENWQNKNINENHNTRVAVMTAQLFEAGVGYESKYSTSVNANQKYVAIRGGQYLNNPGTFRLSQNA